jgi:hypothetical protein
MIDRDVSVEVDIYLEALSRVRSSVQHALPGRPVLMQVYRFYRSHLIDKTGTLHDGTTYNVHGAGLSVHREGW